MHLRTPDEDFGLLLEAAQLYDRAVQATKLDAPPLPNLVVFVTGAYPARHSHIVNGGRTL